MFRFVPEMVRFVRKMARFSIARSKSKLLSQTILKLRSCLEKWKI